MRAAKLVIGLGVMAPTLAAASAAMEIPVGFRGVWAPTLEGCHDPDGTEQLHLTARSLTFYEARSDAADFWVESIGSRHVRVLTQLSGEGTKALVSLDFELAVGSLFLNWSGYGRDPSRRSRYVRCAP